MKLIRCFQIYYEKICNLCVLINDNIFVLTENVYVSQYVELLAIQKSVFEINRFEEIDIEIISQAVNYCLKQPNFRNFIVLDSLYKKLIRLKNECNANS